MLLSGILSSFALYLSRKTVHRLAREERARVWRVRAPSGSSGLTSASWAHRDAVLSFTCECVGVCVCVWVGACSRMWACLLPHLNCVPTNALVRCMQAAGHPATIVGGERQSGANIIKAGSPKETKFTIHLPLIHSEVCLQKDRIDYAVTYVHHVAEGFLAHIEGADAVVVVLRFRLVRHMRHHVGDLLRLAEAGDLRRNGPSGPGYKEAMGGGRRGGKEIESARY